MTGRGTCPTRREGVAAPTNVAKLALCVAVGADSDQVLLYEPGVGTTRGDRVLGGGFGYGLSQNIRHAYRFLAEHYEPGDDLFLFGFSRGAYTGLDDYPAALEVCPVTEDLNRARPMPTQAA